MCSTTLFWTAALSCSNAAPIATPTPGSGSTLAAPAPNPAQFNFAPLNPLPAAQLNSDIYGPWYAIQTLIAALNATGAGAYACGPCISSIVNGTGMNASLGAQGSGVGVALTVALGHGDYVDVANTQTVTGQKTFSQPVQSDTYNNSAGTANIIYRQAGTTCVGNNACAVSADNAGNFNALSGTFTRTVQSASDLAHPSYDGPTYTSAGANAGTMVGSSSHQVDDVVTGQTQTCINTQIGTTGFYYHQCTIPSITLSGAAGFSAIGTYHCWSDLSESGPPGNVFFPRHYSTKPSSGNSFQLEADWVDNNSTGDTNILTVSVFYTCRGK